MSLRDITAAVETLGLEAAFLRFDEAPWFRRWLRVRARIVAPATQGTANPGPDEPRSDELGPVAPGRDSLAGDAPSAMDGLIGLFATDRARVRLDEVGGLRSRWIDLDTFERDFRRLPDEEEVYELVTQPVRGIWLLRDAAEALQAHLDRIGEAPGTDVSSGDVSSDDVSREGAPREGASSDGVSGGEKPERRPRIAAGDLVLHDARGRIYHLARIHMRGRWARCTSGGEAFVALGSEGELDRTIKALGDAVSQGEQKDRVNDIRLHVEDLRRQLLHQAEKVGLSVAEARQLSGLVDLLSATAGSADRIDDEAAAERVASRLTETATEERYSPTAFGSTLARAMADGLVPNRAAAIGATVDDWLALVASPLYRSAGLRAFSRSLFARFLENDIEDVMMLPPLQHGETGAAQLVGDWVRAHGRQVGETDLLKIPEMPGYQAMAELWTAAGFGFLLVEDEAGVYVYGVADPRPSAELRQKAAADGVECSGRDSGAGDPEGEAPGGFAP